MSEYSQKLKQILKDDKQKEAYYTEDSTVVVAGPGSGKTTVLTLKIMRLLNDYIKEPQGLACLTYSREAAREFKDRLKKLGYIERKNVFLGTVHAFCISEILGSFLEIYDYGICMPIKVISKKSKMEIFKQIKEEYNIKYLKMSEMDKERTLQISGKSKVSVDRNDIAWKVALEYDKRLQSLGMVDYEKIIIISTKMIQEHEYVRKCLAAKFPWIVIDEYQDLGRPLHEMVLELFDKTDIKIFAVGDKDQSIYGFQGAVPDYMQELCERDDIKKIELVNNYRSNQDIVDGSEIVLNKKRGYHAATRKGEKAEYTFIKCRRGLDDQYQYFVTNIFPYYKSQGVDMEEICVLLQNNDQCKELASYCMNSNIPYYISKHDFERSDFVKWLESCATWTNDDTAISFDDIYEYWKGLLLMGREDKHFNLDDDLKARENLYNVLKLGIEKKSNLKEWIEYIQSALSIETVLANSKQMPDELDNIELLYKEICNEQYNTFDTSKFSKIGKPDNQISISTRHSSKGLEFEVVVMMGMEEGHFPDWRKNDENSLAEENRMCFVCVSRAKKVCILMYSTEFLEYSKKYDRKYIKSYYPSRYLIKLYEKYGPKK